MNLICPYSCPFLLGMLHVLVYRRKYFENFVFLWSTLNNSVFYQVKLVGFDSKRWNICFCRGKKHLNTDICLSCMVKKKHIWKQELIRWISSQTLSTFLYFCILKFEVNLHAIKCSNLKYDYQPDQDDINSISIIP